MQLLADQKLIEILPGKESRVTPIDFASIREDYLILAKLNALAIQFAFPHITAQHIKELEELNEQIKTSSFTTFAELDNEFHTQILDALKARDLDTAKKLMYDNFAYMTFISAVLQPSRSPHPGIHLRLLRSPHPVCTPSGYG